MGALNFTTPEGSRKQESMRREARKARALAPFGYPAAMADLTSPRLIKFKGVLFLFLGVLASCILLAEVRSMRLTLLFGIAVWSFCRFYYFAFYVIQHYVEPGFRFAGLGAFARYLWSRRRSR
jgi:hypothetical protein